MGKPQIFRKVRNKKFYSWGVYRKKRISIYLFDEPTGNLDRNSTELFLNEVEKLVNEEKIVIVVTHDKDVIARASKVINMDEFH